MQLRQRNKRSRRLQGLDPITSIPPRKKRRVEKKEKRKKKKKKVCLFGLSANPPTGIGGHAGIVSYLSSLKSDETSSTVGSEKLLFDKIIVLPVYKHMFSSKRDQASYNHRLEMCRLTFKDIPNVQVSDQERVVFEKVAAEKNISSVEEKSKLRIGTSDLLDYLLELNKTREVNEEYILAMGADTFMDLTSYKWKRSKDIINMVGGRFIVKVRESDKSTTKASITKRINDLKLDVRLNTVGVTSVSSTAARGTRDEKILSNLLNADVIEYIKSNEMYKFAKND